MQSKLEWVTIKIPIGKELGSLVSEIQLENKLGDEFADIGDELAHKLKDELENQDEINEVVMSIVAYVMLSNGIMGLTSKLVKRISKKYNFGWVNARRENRSICESKR